MFKVLQVVKIVTQLGVSVGVGMIAGTAIAAVPVAPAGFILRGCVKMGAMAMEGYAVDKVTEHVGEQFDKLEENIKQLQAELLK